MKVFDAKHIKNIVLLGSHGSGKTTLAETMLFEAGLITRRGRVEDKNTTSDHHDLEHERGSSVYSTVLHTEWRNFKINIIDTPGLDDLVGETMPALRVADTCVLLLNAQHGAVHTATALVLERMVVAHGVLVLDTAAALQETRFEEHCFGQRGLAASVGAEENNVLDVLCIEDFHGRR